MKKKFLGVSYFVLFGLVAAYAFERWAVRSELETLKVKGELIKVEGASMHIQCLGSGSPTIILESGLGSDMTSWDNIVGPVSKMTRVCRYDRSGYGLSEANPSEATIENQSHRLKELLNAASIKGPKILVGHSAGGLYARHFATLEPAVVGMVLVDASASLSKEDFEKFFTIPTSSKIKGRLNLIASKFALIRVKSWFLPNPKDIHPKWYPNQNIFSSRYIEALFQDDNIYLSVLSAPEPDLHNIPIVVISRGKNMMNNGSKKSVFDIAWDGWQKKLLNLSSHSSQIIAEESGHGIQDNQPELIVNAIESLLKEGATPPRAINHLNP
ncbi:MAG: alpha/beta hydrolase [Oligoflexales bacterium]